MSKKSGIDGITKYSRKRDEIKRMSEERKAEKRRLKALEEDVPDALDGCGSIERWEEIHGRGFWGNETSGYVYDKYNR